MSAKTLDEVARMLTWVTERAVHDQSRIGYFAALYLRMTRAVHARIREGGFHDAEATARFNIIFANRYFDALIADRNGRPLARVWKIAFDDCRTSELIVLQHLYQGLAGHVMFDLAISAAQACPGESISSLRGDFEKINSVVESLMRDVHRDLGTVSVALGLLDTWAGDLWAACSQLATSYVRERAWEAAVRLARGVPAEVAAEIEDLDARAAKVAEQVARPAGGVSGVGGLLGVVRTSESRDVRRVIRVIEGAP